MTENKITNFISSQCKSVIPYKPNNLIEEDRKVIDEETLYKLTNINVYTSFNDKSIVEQSSLMTSNQFGFNNIEDHFIHNNNCLCDIKMNQFCKNCQINLNKWSFDVNKELFLTNYTDIMKINNKSYNFEEFSKLLENDEMITSLNINNKIILNKGRWKKAGLSILFFIRLKLLRKNKGAKIIQSWWRGCMVRNKTNKFLKIYKDLLSFSKYLDSEMAFIKEYNFDCQRELYKQGNQIFVLIYKARSFCKDLNDKRIKTLTKERNDIQTKLLDFIVFTNKVKKDLEITNKKEGERIKNIEEIVQNRNIDETIEIIINKKQNFIEIQNDIKKKIKNVKSYKLDFVHDFKMEDLNEFEKEFCNNINKDYEIINLAYCDDKFTEEELISMSYGELRRNIKTLNDEEKIKQCKNEIKRRVEEW